MLEKVYSNPDVYNVFVPLPDNPLKNLNCYVIKTKDRNLIIDTGFNRPECLEALTAGLKELEIDLNKTDMFLTHLHSDHTGLAASILPKTATIYMGKVDYEYLMTAITGTHWEKTEKQFYANGFPYDKIVGLRKTNPARAFSITGPFEATTLLDGDKFTIGEYTFTCVFTPGHTPGHMCLYCEDKKLMFLGDHILFDITPNITAWTGVGNSLQNYLDSLKKIRGFEMLTALPGHRKNSMNVYVRIEQLLEHHKNRLADTLNVVSAMPNSTAYEIAEYMKWSMRGKCWDEFPITQRWFAVGETISHLDYLLADNKLIKTVSDGIDRYSAK